MSKVILHKHKYSTDHYDASTPEKKEKSLKKIFKANKDMQYYWNLEKSEFEKEVLESEKEIQKLEEMEALHLKHKDESEAKNIKIRITRIKSDLLMQKKDHLLYLEAKKGNVKAIETLLQKRSDYEYEGFEYVDLL